VKINDEADDEVVWRQRSIDADVFDDFTDAVR